MDQVEEDLKRMKIIGWRVKVEGRERVEQNCWIDQDPPRVVESIEEEYSGYDKLGSCLSTGKALTKQVFVSICSAGSPTPTLMFLTALQRLFVLAVRPMSLSVWTVLRTGAQTRWSGALGS
jgi:hypothetical protein